VGVSAAAAQRAAPARPAGRGPTRDVAVAAHQGGGRSDGPLPPGGGAGIGGVALPGLLPAGVPRRPRGDLRAGRSRSGEAVEASLGGKGVVCPEGATRVAKTTTRASPGGGDAWGVKNE